MFPIIITTAGYQLFGKTYFADAGIYAVSTLLIGSVSISFWYLYFSMIQRLAGYFTTLADMWKRVVWLILLDIVVVKLNMAAIFMVSTHSGFLVTDSIRSILYSVR